MQLYKGYFIKGSALLVHPFSPEWYVGGSFGAGMPQFYRGNYSLRTS